MGGVVELVGPAVVDVVGASVVEGCTTTEVPGGVVGAACWTSAQAAPAIASAINAATDGRPLIRKACAPARSLSSAQSAGLAGLVQRADRQFPVIGTSLSSCSKRDDSNPSDDPETGQAKVVTLAVTTFVALPWPSAEHEPTHQQTNHRVESPPTYSVGAELQCGHEPTLMRRTLADTHTRRE